MIPLPDVQRRILTTVSALPAEPTPLAQAAGLALAEPISAPEDVPPFTNSAMDGYAVIAADTTSAPVTLQAGGEVAAGGAPSEKVEPGRAVRIMTGAPLPPGADAVVKIEDTEPADGGVRILASVEAGEAVRPAGDDVQAGDVVFEAGTRVGPAHIGVLASLGITRPTVRKRPVVTVIVTGDELRPAYEEHLAPGQIRNSNGPMLVELLAELGAEVVEAPTVGDDEKAFLQTLHRATQESDAVITSGGVSMGDYDVVKAVLSRFDDVKVWQVAMKPAKPSAFGLVHGVPVFALPGNPVSVTVGFEQFARPALLHMMGSHRLFRPRVIGVLGEPVRSDPEKIEFKRAVLAREGDDLMVSLAGGQGSHQLAALAAADAFAILPVGIAALDVGDPVEVELFRAAETRTAAEALGE